MLLDQEVVPAPAPLVAEHGHEPDVGAEAGGAHGLVGGLTAVDGLGVALAQHAFARGRYLGHVHGQSLHMCARHHDRTGLHLRSEQDIHG